MNVRLTPVTPVGFVLSDPDRPDGPLGPAFWTAVGLLFVAILTPREAGTALIALVLNGIEQSPVLTDVVRRISRKAASADRPVLEEFLYTAVVSPTRKILFLTAVSVLAWPLVSAGRAAEWCRDRHGLRRYSRITAIVFAGVLLLVLPAGLRQMGDGFARLSEDPFGAPASEYARRLVVPALAEALGFRGGVYYLLYSLLLGLLSVFLLVVWCDRARLRLPVWALVSVASSSFIVYNHLMPGYVDQMLVILVFALGLLPLDSRGRLAVVTLGLGTHELSVLLLGPLAIWTFSPRERKAAAVVTILYGSIFLLANGPWLGRLVEAHASIGPFGWTPLEYARGFPDRLLLGVLAAQKAFWIVIAAALLWTWRTSGQLRWPLTLIVAAPLAVLPMVVDTSRFAGWTFVALLLAIRITVENHASGRSWVRGVAAVNLAIPSVYVGLNTGPITGPGLYQLWSAAF
jgi:hypothetical protein